jgi:TolB-like protein
LERKLTAILCADVFGYSRLMGEDEESTLLTLSSHRKLIDSLIQQHHGRFVNSAGDSVLAEFASVVNAVQCAVEVQATLKAENANLQPERRMEFRIGINLGDVMVDGEQIYGDGVNVAARLESLAEPGGICISNTVHDHVRGKVAVEFADLGEQSLKNIERPIRAHRVVSDRVGPNAPAAASSAPRFSMVVLPFANLGGDPEQEYFVDGVTESLTTDLSRITGISVIARNSAFYYKGQSPDVRQIGRELGVRYVLEGSVQRGSNRMRVNVQLIDAETGNHLWAERFDKPVADFFDMQDEIVARLAGQLGTQLVGAEARRAERSPHPDSMDLCFQGIACVHKGWSPENLQQARRFFERALALDPNNVSALVGEAAVDVTVGSSAMTDDPTALFAAAIAASTKALSVAPNSAMAHLVLGAAHNGTNRPAQAIEACEHALALDRNLAGAHAIIGAANFSWARRGN